MQRLTHAQVVASAGDAPVLESGGVTDFHLGPTPQVPPLKVDRIIADGGRANLGGVVMTAHVTAGHTKGCTTWTPPAARLSAPKRARRSKEAGGEVNR